MLAALIATRRVIPPPPIVIFYSNQFVAATTTFACIFLAKRAAALTTNLALRYTILFSMQGSPSIVSQLDLLYANLISARASDNPDYLSTNIAQTIVVLTQLNGIIQSLPVSAMHLVVLTDIQKRMAYALYVMNSLGRVIH